MREASSCLLFLASGCLGLAISGPHTTQVIEAKVSFERTAFAVNADNVSSPQVEVSRSLVIFSLDLDNIVA